MSSSADLDDLLELSAGFTRAYAMVDPNVALRRLLDPEFDKKMKKMIEESDKIIRDVRARRKRR